jgi:hypothetical protein
MMAAVGTSPCLSSVPLFNWSIEPVSPLTRVVILIQYVTDLIVEVNIAQLEWSSRTKC